MDYHEILYIKGKETVHGVLFVLFLVNYNWKICTSFLYYHVEKQYQVSFVSPVSESFVPCILWISWLCLVGPSSAAFHWLSNSAKSILPSYISISYQRDFHRFSQPCLHYVLRTGTSLRYKVWLATPPSYLLLRLHDFYVLCIKRILFLACWENIRGPSHNVMLSPSLHRQHILSWRWISTIRWLSR